MAFRIRKLAPDDPADSFPDPLATGVALGFPDGLIAIGGDLSPERLVAAYTKGIFPWYNEGEEILWWFPAPRAVIYPDKFHVSRSLAHTMRNDDWSYSLNQDFQAVIRACARNRGKHGTWITTEMIDAYCQLHELGYAHSVESWLGGELAGGIYGIRLGKVFFGESMFSSHTGGSKIAISGLIQVCIQNDIELLDCQLASDHLSTLGMQEISREQFTGLLSTLVTSSPCPDWSFAPESARNLENLRKSGN